MPFGMPKSTRKRRLATVAAAALSLAGGSAAFAPPASAATLDLYVYSYQNPSVTGQNVELYASAWSGCSVTSYAWNFGDGSATSGPNAYYVTHTWKTAGAKTVTVTANDSCGNSTTETYVQDVVANSAPKAAFTTTVSSSNPLTVYADPADSSDTDPAPLSYYEWYWGDGGESYFEEGSSTGGPAAPTDPEAGA